ncbi:MAG: DUF4097 family beta strand repeat protein [Clostridiales bacterium]|jgi:DUF4097 and DUF4098 domain-containing protein YvlB|nr:DUF4097 family beta strand repeat protein [Clostridiales bacterium]
MNKEQYLERLESLIHTLPAAERRRMIGFYRRMIEDKMARGETEQQAVAEMGDVSLLAQKILTEYPGGRRSGAGRIAGIAVASFFAILIIAGFVFHGLNLRYQEGAYQNAQAGVQNSETMEQKTETAPVSGITKIDVDAQNKEVVVERGGSDQIVFTYWTDSNQSFTFSNQSGVVSLMNRDRESWNFFDFFRSRSRTQVHVAVPESYAGEIYLHSSNGKVTVDNVAQLTRLTCDTSNSSVRLNQVEADEMVLDTSNGPIQMNDVIASSVSARSSNGSVSFSNLSCPDITLDTSNGSIRGNILGKETDYTIRTDTSNGKCTPQSRSGGSKKLDADTSNGSISITFSDSNS